MIDGVKIIPLKRIPDDRGKIMHMLRSSDSHFENFGEIYFSFVYPGIVKGWHIHERMVLNYAVITGMIRLVLYDDREDSPTQEEIQEIYLGEDNYCLVKIPPKIWNGIRGLGVKTSIIANCASIPFDENEITRLDPRSPQIPYDWSIKWR